MAPSSTCAYIACTDFWSVNTFMQLLGPEWSHTLLIFQGPCPTQYTPRWEFPKMRCSYSRRFNTQANPNLRKVPDLSCFLRPMCDGVEKSHRSLQLLETIGNHATITVSWPILPGFHIGFRFPCEVGPQPQENGEIHEIHEHLGTDSGLLYTTHVEVSINGGTPKSSILMGYPLLNHLFWGYPHLWKRPYPPDQGSLPMVGVPGWPSRGAIPTLEINYFQAEKCPVVVTPKPENGLQCIIFSGDWTSMKQLEITFGLVQQIGTWIHNWFAMIRCHISRRLTVDTLFALGWLHPCTPTFCHRTKTVSRQRQKEFFDMAIFKFHLYGFGAFPPDHRHTESWVGIGLNWSSAASLEGSLYVWLWWP